MIPEGYYDGTIESAWIETFGNTDDLIMAFSIKLGVGDVVTARHATSGDWGHLGKKVAEQLELPWPGGLEKIETTVGRTVRVRVKHKEFRNGDVMAKAYIVIDRSGEPAEPDKIKSGIAKLANTEVKDDNVPF